MSAQDSQAKSLLTEEYHWRQLKGERYKYVSEKLDETFVMLVVIACAVLEPLRFLTTWYLRRSSVPERVKTATGGEGAAAMRHGERSVYASNAMFAILFAYVER